MVIEASRSTITAASAEIGRAKAAAAADAGLAIALQSLVSGGVQGEIPLDGRVRHVRFDDADLAIAIEDEQGKVPLNAIDEEQARRLFTAMGVTGDRLDILTDSFLDWLDEDDSPRPSGAEADYYAPLDIHPRNGMLRSVAETGLIRGFDPALVDRLEAVATVHFGRGPFKPEHASPIAIGVMEGEEQGAVDLLNRQRALAGQETSLSTESASTLVGRPVTVRIEASRADGAQARLRQIIVLTGRRDMPYMLRERY